MYKTFQKMKYIFKIQNFQQKNLNIKKESPYLNKFNKKIIKKIKKNKKITNKSSNNNKQILKKSTLILLVKIRQI